MSTPNGSRRPLVSAPGAVPSSTPGPKVRPPARTVQAARRAAGTAAIQRAGGPPTIRFEPAGEPLLAELVEFLSGA